MKELCQTSGQPPAVLRDNNGHVSHQFVAPCSRAVHNLPNEDIIVVAVREDLKACLVMFRCQCPQFTNLTHQTIFMSHIQPGKSPQKVFGGEEAPEKKNLEDDWVSRLSVTFKAVKLDLTVELELQYFAVFNYNLSKASQD